MTIWPSFIGRQESLVQFRESKVHFRLVYSRFQTNGARYITHEALRIVSRVDGQWGICLMSLYISKTAA